MERKNGREGGQKSLMQILTIYGARNISQDVFTLDAIRPKVTESRRRLRQRIQEGGFKAVSNSTPSL